MGQEATKVFGPDSRSHKEVYKECADLQLTEALQKSKQCGTGTSIDILLWAEFCCPALAPSAKLISLTPTSSECD